MKLLVTGGAGYKGVLLTEKLLSLGHQVTILDNFMYGYDPILHLVSNDRLHVLKADIRNVDAHAVKGFDVVFHLAGISGYPACEANPHSAQLINVEASRLLGEVLGKEQGLIYASTTSFYGSGGRVCDEDTPVAPVSLYGQTKYQAEQLLLQRENTISLRFATLFGVSPRMRVDLLVNDFAYRAVHDRCVVLFESKSKRTFLHVRDGIDAYAFALEHFAEMKHGIFNVGDDALNFSKMDIAEAIQKKTKCKIIDSDMKDFDVRDFVICFDKLHHLGYRPQRTLADGVAELVKLYRFYQPFSPFKPI